ncbi:MAG: helix-turn-helix domain-containing protein [Starkeya sp.]|nr:helix-turn-helix domain-containing protein [Starkeya sp.]
MLAPNLDAAHPLEIAAADYEIVRRAVEYVNLRFRDQPEVEEIARASGVHPRALTDLFRRWCGLTPKDFLQAVTIDAARRRDDGQNVSTEASSAKMFATEMCGRVADRAVQILGGSGYMAEYGIERFYRDVRLFRLYEGTTQIQQIIIARNMVREARANA